MAIGECFRFGERTNALTSGSFITLEDVNSLRKALRNLPKEDRPVMSEWLKQHKPHLADIIKRSGLERWLTCNVNVGWTHPLGIQIPRVLTLTAGDISSEAWAVYTRSPEKPTNG